MKRILILAIVILTTIASKAQKFDEKKISDHIKTLSSDAMQGRGTGKDGEKMAAEYIQKQFKKLVKI